MEALDIAVAAVCAFFGIAFLQSGSDKVADWKGNFDWLSGHFENSTLKGAVPLLLGILTFAECLSGLLCAAAAVSVFVDFAPRLPAYALTAVAVTLLMLFFGQRVAKDYAGAAVIANYFAVCLLGLWLVAT